MTKPVRHESFEVDRGAVRGLRPLSVVLESPSAKGASGIGGTSGADIAVAKLGIDLGEALNGGRFAT